MAFLTANNHSIASVFCDLSISIRLYLLPLLATEGNSWNFCLLALSRSCLCQCLCWQGSPEAVPCSFYLPKEDLPLLKGAWFEKEPGLISSCLDKGRRQTFWTERIYDHKYLSWWRFSLQYSSRSREGKILFYFHYKVCSHVAFLLAYLREAPESFWILITLKLHDQKEVVPMWSFTMPLTEMSPVANFGNKQINPHLLWTDKKSLFV